MRLSISYYKQQTDYTCGPASLRMALAYFGMDKSEQELAGIAGTTEKIGTTHNGMLAVIRDAGLCAHAAEHVDIGDIVRFLGKKFPVIVDYTEPSENIGHYAVVVGISTNPLTRKRSIILNDPWNGKGFKLAESEFLSRWHDSDIPEEPSERWIMVISNTPIFTGSDEVGGSSWRRLVSIAARPLALYNRPDTADPRR